jgi:2-dehydropantoate 2-reductase
MRILVFGAGPLGSLMAARLHEAGQEVTLLARGQRLADLRTYGVVLEDAVSGTREMVPVPTVEHLAPSDRYDLIMVVMRKNQALAILPTLAANTATPTVLFMMNNAAGAADLCAALGRERVMLGFPLPGGERAGHVMRIVPVGAAQQWTIPIGEPDGRITERTRHVAEVLSSMRGYRVELRHDMEAWLTCHVAVVAPALCAAIYAANTDPQRLARTPDALILAARGLQEALRALQVAGVPLTPAKLRLIPWMPEALVVRVLAKTVARPELEASLRGHPLAARDEMQFLSDEFLALVKRAGARTPTLDQLSAYFDPETPPLPAGSHHLQTEQRQRWLVGAIIAVGLACLWHRRTTRAKS